jgi:hypothetical protein
MLATACLFDHIISQVFPDGKEKINAKTSLINIKLAPSCNTSKSSINQYKSILLLFLTLHVSALIEPSSGGNTCTSCLIALANAMYKYVQVLPPEDGSIRAETCSVRNNKRIDLY